MRISSIVSESLGLLSLAVELGIGVELVPWAVELGIGEDVGRVRKGNCMPGKG